MTPLPKDFWRKAYANLSRLLPPGNPVRSPEDIVEVNALLDTCREQQAIAATRVERGKKVLEWRIPAALAPTMNEIGGHKTRRRWMLGKIKEELTDRLRRIIETTPDALVHGDKTQRWVRVVRFTVQPNRIDDTASADTIGGKFPIDVMVKQGVLVDDTPALCRREALVRKTSRGNTHVLISVHETSAEEVPDEGPRDASVEQVKWVKGKLVQAIEESTP